MRYAVIVNDHGEYFYGWCAHMAPRYDGDDDTFVTRPGWTTKPSFAKIFTERYARKLVERVRRKTFFGEVAVMLDEPT